MSDGTITAYLAKHPKLTLIISGILTLSMSGVAAADYAIHGP